jgi:hypothetical protein
MQVLPFKASEAVAGEMPAARATSRRVVGLRSSLPAVLLRSTTLSIVQLKKLEPKVLYLLLF